MNALPDSLGAWGEGVSINKTAGKLVGRSTDLSTRANDLTLAGTVL